MSTREPQNQLKSSIAELNADLLDAVSERAYGRIPAILESQRIAVNQLSRNPHDSARPEIERGLREALVLATVQRLHLNELIEACRRQSNTLVAYRCDPAGPSLFSSCG